MCSCAGVPTLSRAAARPFTLSLGACLTCSVVSRLLRPCSMLVCLFNIMLSYMRCEACQPMMHVFTSRFLCLQERLERAPRKRPRQPCGKPPKSPQAQRLPRGLVGLQRNAVPTALQEPALPQVRLLDIQLRAALGVYNLVNVYLHGCNFLYPSSTSICLLVQHLSASFL